MAGRFSRLRRGAPEPEDAPTAVHPALETEPVKAESVEAVESAEAAQVELPAEEGGSDAAGASPSAEHGGSGTDGSGIDEGEAASPPTEDGSPGFAERGRLRRRLRQVRQVREVALRDLGGLVFDLHRFERERPDLVAAKLAGLGEVDTEMRALQEALGQPDEPTVLRIPGLTSCPVCGTLNGSDATYCTHCGHRFGDEVEAPADEATPGQLALDEPAAEPAAVDAP